MNYSSLSDLGQSMMLRRQSSELTTTLVKLTTELTTREVQDVGKKVRGNFGVISGLESSLLKLDGFSLGRSNIGQQVSNLQTTLGAMEEVISNYGTELAAATGLEQPEVLEAHLSGASGRLSEVISRLNVQVSGEYLFSGSATGQKPLISGDEMLAQMSNLAAMSTGVSDFVMQVDAWFDDLGGGFETLAYGGGSQARSNISISEHQEIDLPLKADNQNFRAMLKGLAVSAVISQGDIAATSQEKRDVLSSVAQNLISAELSLIEMQRDTGQVEALLERADVAAVAEKSVLEMARSEILSIDPYETASALEAVQFQIETLYVLTARTSQLRLSDYL
ncbi:MAG: hypothetical protein ABJN34_06535 [Litoreibacter sp.]|uniref:hypothetical protein n=1 Tax=Litoreibacter sp. TaxID=1969459 RepID=UPI00329A3E24